MPVCKSLKELKEVAQVVALKHLRGSTGSNKVKGDFARGGERARAAWQAEPPQTRKGQQQGAPVAGVRLSSGERGQDKAACGQGPGRARNAAARRLAAHLRSSPRQAQAQEQEERTRRPPGKVAS